jgi:SAM-dependent methyltransferase
MIQSVIHCPICESSEIRTIGPILHPQPTLVAGVEIDLGDTSYSLRSCRQCTFQFKDPPIPSEILMACYTQADSANWETNPDPHFRKFDVLRNVIEKYSTGRRILDIGCFNGALLKYLGKDWQKFGIEPSADAARLAEARGVHILAPMLEDVDFGQTPFNAVVAIDVVEHVADPLGFFRRTGDLVAPGGVLVVLTGDTRSLAWRLQRSMYWYCSLPEHVSYYSRKSLDMVGSIIGMHGIEYRRMSHDRKPLRTWCLDTFKNAAYIIGRKVGGFGIPSMRRLFVERRGPTTQSSRDHLLYVFRKPNR